MDVTRKIRRSFADEHVIGIDPPLRPEQPNVWRRRINAFAGRSLSDKAMTAEQALRSGMQRLYGLSLSPGRVEGLDLSAEPDSFGAAPEKALVQLSPGLGVARSGEDVQVGRTTRLPLGELPVVLRVDHADMLAAPPPAGDDGDGGPIVDMPPMPDEEGGFGTRIRPELPRTLGDTLSTIAANKLSLELPHVAVLIAQPIVTEILGRPLDPCAPDPRDDAYVDLQRIDGARLLLYLWPSEMIAVDGGPDYALPPDNVAMRNRLAYSIFNTERLQAEGDMHPWEAWGLPLALVGFRSDWTLSFIDRHAVARVGGTPKDRTALVTGAGDARLWQAQLDQFTAQLTEIPNFDTDLLLKAFQTLPPVGILPPSLLDPVTRRQHFFPSSFSVTAVPLAQSNFNLVVSESACLAPLERGVPSAVEMLVPVPDSVYEPGLLEVEMEDPRFGQAIKDLRDDREAWLVRRQMARRRYDRLMETVSGAVMGWPASDLPLEENTPAPHVQTPVEVTRTRRIAAGAATRTHVMANAHATLTVAASDTIWFWLRIQNAAQLTGLSLRLASANAGGAPAFTKGVYWGAPDALPIFSEQAGLAARTAGNLPESNIWVRLDVPATAIWDSGGKNLDGFAINAVEFSQHGGDVEWASFGKLDAGGMVYTYVADDAPAGATLTTDGASGWPWANVAGREEITVSDFGTVVTDDVRRASALDKFRGTWTQDFLRADLEAVDENGIGAFLTAVDARLKATNDAIDLGFVRARSDIYRVRQIMLGADAASRLVTSPALADLALRDEGARATSKGISEFLTNSITRKPTDAVINMLAVPPPPPPPPPPPSGFQANFMTLNTLSLAQSQPQSVLSLFGATRIAAPPPPPPPSSSFLPLALTTPLMTPVQLSTTTALSTQSVFQTQVARPATGLLSVAASLDMSRYRATDIQRQIPIAGLVERTVSVAERLTPQPAVQALEYALASKAAVVSTLSALSKGSSGKPVGIAIDDIPVAGYHHKTSGQVPSLADLVADMARPLASQVFVDEDTLPQTQAQKHESDYFTYAVQAIDNSVAIMRLVEGRVALFEELAASLAELKAQILASADEAAAYLRSVDVEVAEARHDLGTAERLREEEGARIEAVNARRAAILANHVHAIAWRRGRAVDVRDEIPLIEIASGLAPNPVVVCRREHEEAPDEIHDYVQLLREVPVSWFPAIADMVKRIERLESAQAAMRTMIERALLPRSLAAPVQVTAASRFLIGVQNAMVAGRQVVDARRSAVTLLDVGRIPALSLVEAHTQLTTLSTIGDLITGSHRQPALTRAANDEIDGLTTVAGCLHESFGEVPPIVRLGWAETLSEFDRPAPLANLAGLPGWGEIAIELRRKLQGFVDWLFSRIDLQQQPARDAVNELVRICLLMAAHAPVDKIIPAHLVTPAPAKLGSKLFLALDVSRVRKGMTALVRDDQDRIVSRAVVDDIVDGRVQATVTQITMPVTTFTPAMRFQLVGGIAR